MIDLLSVPPVALIACSTTWPTEYASATSALTSDGVALYCVSYSATIFSLSAFS